MTAPRRVTITVSIPAAVHLIIGIILAAASAAGFWIHFELPPAHQYRETASDIANLLGCTALAYWLWCVLQRNRSEHANLDQTAREAIATAEARHAQKQGVLAEIVEEVIENRAAIKDLEGRLSELLAAVEALQDCYLSEGQAIALPAEEWVRRRHST